MTREIRTNLYEGNLARQQGYRGYEAGAYGGRDRVERNIRAEQRSRTERRADTYPGRGRAAWKEPVYEGQKGGRYQSGVRRKPGNSGKKSGRRKKKEIQRKILQGMLLYFLIAGVIATCFVIFSIFGGFEKKAHAAGAMKGSISAQEEETGKTENEEEIYGENRERNPLEVTPEIRQECQELYGRQEELLLLVNKDHELQVSYQPALRSICKGRLEAAEILYEDLCAMLAAGEDAGYQYWIASAHRDRSYQQGLVDEDVEKYMSKGYSYEAALQKTYKYTMPAGKSEHETGLALDILCSTNTIMDESQAYEAGNKWLVEHCHEYGFILRYPADKEDITGINYEPWHFRYVGKEAAACLKEKGWTLEEFYEAME